MAYKVRTEEVTPRQDYFIEDESGNKVAIMAHGVDPEKLTAQLNAGAKALALKGVLAELQAERLHQDERWGGPERDDEHDIAYWYDRIKERLYMPTDFALVDAQGARVNFIEIAALAVATVESIDRKDEADGDC